MRMFFKRTVICTFIVLIFVSSFSVYATTLKFTDLNEDNEYLVEAVELLSEIGVVKGTSDSTFGTDALVTREQMAAFVYRFMKSGRSSEGGINTTPFTDLDDPTYFNMISWANASGIIKGTSPTTFNPKGSITLQDAYTMLVRALVRTFDYETEKELVYPDGYIEFAEREGIMLNKGIDSSINYRDALTRGDIAIILYNAFFADFSKLEKNKNENDEEKVIVEQTCVIGQQYISSNGYGVTIVQADVKQVKGVKTLVFEYTIENLTEDKFLYEKTFIFGFTDGTCSHQGGIYLDGMYPGEKLTKKVNLILNDKDVSLIMFDDAIEKETDSEGFGSINDTLSILSGKIPQSYFETHLVWYLE